MSLIGKTLGRCHLESLLGEGASAQVYKGTHQTLGIPVAVKVLKTAPQAAMASHQATYRDRFRREAQLAARIAHEGLVRVLDFGDELGHLYLVMEFVDGYSLAQYLRNTHSMPEDMALKVIAYLCEPLSSAHAQNIIHRDLKPSNILITRTGWLKISDLGVAKDLAQRDLTQTDTMLGTPFYMAPECFQTGKTVDRSADIYSLGIILYEMLMGKPPFAGTLNQVISGHLTGEATWTAVRQGIKAPLPEPTVAILRALLAKEPRHRPESCAAVSKLCHDRLRSLAGGAPSALVGDRVRTSGLAGESSTFGRIGQFMEKNLGSRSSEYQGRQVVHTTGRERLLIWAMLAVFVGGCLAAYMYAR